MGWGIAHVASVPPDVVLFVDADCRHQAHFVQRLKVVCQAAVQAYYLMHGAEDSLIKPRTRPCGVRLDPQELGPSARTEKPSLSGQLMGTLRSSHGTRSNPFAKFKTERSEVFVRSV
jgi:hypothetical protein